MRSTIGLLVALAAAPAAASGQSCPPAPTPDPAAGPMTDVRWLADDALEGRAVGSLGGLCATAYLAARFDAIGLRPAGPGGSFLQPFRVRTGSAADGTNALAVGGRRLAAGTDWGPYGFAGSGAVEAALVYGGAGVAHPGGEPPVDVDGRIAVLEIGTPGAGGVYEDPHFKGTIAAGSGAAAVVLLLPEGAPLPDPAPETRPFLAVPVVAVGGAAADAVREAARRGERARVEVAIAPVFAEAANVTALLPGSDPALADEVVVVGAHFDHLGRGGEGSLDPDSHEVHNGADDNASGTAAMLEVARRLAEGPRPARSVLFIGFNGEERGLLGSAYYVSDPARPLESTVAMLNMDMVGRLRDDRLTVYGLGTAPEWDALLDSANATLDAPLAFAEFPDGFGPSDHSSFYGKGIPVLHFFTNTHEDYHRPSDDWERINGPGLERVAELVGAVALRLAGTSGMPATTPTLVMTQPRSAPGGQPTTGGYGPYFGSIPDMSPIETGVRLTGVREDSPAARAGLRAGDVIVEFGGVPVTDLYAYTYALRDHAPGDEVTVVVMRDGERLTFQAVLGEAR